MFERIRAFLNARKVSRWSLYFVHKRDGLKYALHDDAVDILLGYVSAPIKRGKRISPDWELHLKFNFEHKSIRLVEAYFPKGDVSRTLRDLITIIDSGWMVSRSEPVFVDAHTSQRLPLESSDQIVLDRTTRLAAPGARVENRLCDNGDSPVTLASVLSKVIH
jgi:hypothetical protein